MRLVLALLLLLPEPASACDRQKADAAIANPKASAEALERAGRDLMDLYRQKCPAPEELLGQAIVAFERAGRPVAALSASVQAWSSCSRGTRRST